MSKYKIGHIHKDNKTGQMFGRIDKRTAQKAFYAGFWLIVVPSDTLPNEYIHPIDMALNHRISSPLDIDFYVAYYKQHYPIRRANTDIHFYIPITNSKTGDALIYDRQFVDYTY